MHLAYEQNSHVMLQMAPGSNFKIRLWGRTVRIEWVGSGRVALDSDRPTHHSILMNRLIDAR